MIMTLKMKMFQVFPCKVKHKIQNNMIAIIKNSIFQAKQGHIFQIIPIFCYSYGLPIQIGKH